MALGEHGYIRATPRDLTDVLLLGEMGKKGGAAEFSFRKEAHRPTV